VGISPESSSDDPQSLRRCRLWMAGRISVPVERECAVGLGLVATDRDGRTDVEIRPALVLLVDPGWQPSVTRVHDTLSIHKAWLTSLPVSAS
jgi:hypothetical protein